PGRPLSHHSPGDRFVLCPAPLDYFALPGGRCCFASSRSDPGPTTAIPAGIRPVTSALCDYDLLADARAIRVAFGRRSAQTAVAGQVRHARFYFRNREPAVGIIGGSADRAPGRPITPEICGTRAPRSCADEIDAGYYVSRTASCKTSGGARCAANVLMDVSVVIPTRDRPHLLALTLQTALCQECVQTEILVVDDGEEAGTVELVRPPGNNRVRRLRNSGPRGVSGARNTGIAAARGQWVAFLDDDDLWAPRKLAAQRAMAETSGAAWVYAGDATVDEELRVIGGAPPPQPTTVVTELRRHNAVPAGSSNVVVRRDVLDTVGRFDPQLRTSEDWDVWI